MTANLSVSALDIVKKAFSIMGVIDSEIPLQTPERRAGFDGLNYMIKHWQTTGFHLWTQTDAVLPLAKNKQKYLLGPSGDYCFNADDFHSTTLSSAASGDTLTLSSVESLTAAPDILLSNPTVSPSGWTATNSTLADGLIITNTAANGYAEYDLDTEVGQEYIVTASYSLGTAATASLSMRDIEGELGSETVASTATVKLRFTARQKKTTFRALIQGGIGTTGTVSNLNYISTDTGDYIGVILDDGDIQWSRVNFITGSVATLKDSVLSAASSAATVYYGSEIISRPLSLMTARYQYRVGQSEIPSDQWSRTEYFEQPDKTTQGIVSQWYYSPQLTDGALYVWQVAASNAELLHFTYVRPTDISEDNADVPDFPSEWFLPLAYNLASSLLAEYTVPDQKSALIKAEAMQMLDDALGHDNEDTYIQFQVGRH